MCFGSSSPAPTPPPPPPPKRTDPEVKEASAREKKRLSARKGRSSTMLTGGLGITDDAPVAKKPLLGS